MPAENDNTDAFASGFVAGTPVWTDKGLVPIEQLKVGDLVLTQPEAMGELRYKRIIRTFAHGNRMIYNLPTYDFGREAYDTVYASGNHPVWIKDIGWTPLREFPYEPWPYLTLHDGTEVILANMAGAIYRTSVEGVGFITTDAWCEFGYRIDFNNNLKVLSSVDGDVEQTSDHYLYDEKGDDVFFHHRVFNIEVEDNNTYYVGESGLLTGGAGLVTHGTK